MSTQMEQTVHEIDQHIDSILDATLPSAVTRSLEHAATLHTKHKSAHLPLPDYTKNTGSQYTLQHFEGNMIAQNEALHDAAIKITHHVNEVEALQLQFIQQVDEYHDEYQTRLSIDNLTNNLAVQQTTNPTIQRLEKELLLLLSEAKKCEQCIDKQHSRLETLNRMLSHREEANQMLDQSRFK